MDPRTRARNVVLAAVVAVLAAAVAREVVPRFTLESRLAQVEQELLAVPAFEAIKEHDPATYGTILADLRAGIENGLKEDELVAQIKPKIEQMVGQRLVKASDPALVKYIEVMVEELRALNRKDPALCYQFLFPQQYGAVNARKHLPAELLQADLAALAQIVESSARDPQPLPKADDVTPDLQAAVGALVQQHGEGVMATLQNLHDPGVSKATGCAVTADLYGHVLRLPQERGARVLRFMFSQA